MISPRLLALLVWAAIAAWAISALLIWLEFRLRQRRRARAAALFARLTAGSGSMPDTLPEIKGSDFQDLVAAGLPRQLELAVARDLRFHLGDDALLQMADGVSEVSVEERLLALQILTAGCHPDVHQMLGRALRDPEKEVAALALRLLRGLDDEPSARILVEALTDGVYSASRLAAALHRMTVDRRALLGRLLDHPVPHVRFWGLLLVGKTASAGLAARVRALADDPDTSVRRAAVEALARVGTAADSPLIVRLFADPAPIVRLHAARAAASFPDATVAAALVTLLTDREWIVRAAARDALEALGDVATPVVLRTLWHRDAFAANNAAEVLFVTGAAMTLVRGLLEAPQDSDLRQLVAQLLAVAGPHLDRAMHDQLDAHEQAVLADLLRSNLASSRVRRTS